MKNLSILLVVIPLLVSCSGIKVTADYDKTVDFSEYKTYSYYGWTEESDQILNRFDKERIEKSFAEEFSKRGIKYVKEGGELVVSLFIVVDKKTSKTAYTTHYGGSNYGYGRYGYSYGPGWGWGMGHSSTQYSEHDYLEGTLVCDVFNKESKQLIWQGVGASTVDEDPQKREKGIPYAVKAIMSSYPVRIQK